MTRELIIQKAIGFGLVGLAIATMTPVQISLLFSVFGQGHFLGAYYYQWKARKITTRGLILFTLVTSALFAVALSTNRLEWFVLLAGVLFFAHHFLDEVSLWGKERSIFRLIELTPPVLLYSAFTIDVLFGTKTALYASFVSLALLGILVFLVAVKKYGPDELSWYFGLITVSLLAIKWVFAIPVAPEVLLGSVILFHYICWYVYFFFRFANNPQKQSNYVQEMLAIHALVFSVYALFVYTTWGSLHLGYLFLPIYFYIWATIHILFSIRASDFRALLQW